MSFFSGNLETLYLGSKPKQICASRKPAATAGGFDADVF